MSQAQPGAVTGDFSTQILADDGLYFCVTSDVLRENAMLTEKEEGPMYSAPQQLWDTDASADADDVTEMPPWLTDVLPRLEELATLEENWDSYGSPPPPLELMSDALALVQRAERLLGYRRRQETAIPTPSIVPLSGGGVQIEWQRPVKELELEFFEGRPPVALAVDIATGETTERAFDDSDCSTLSGLLAWLMSL